MKNLVCAAALLALPTAAWADRPKADSCAVTLSYESQKIYDASVWDYLYAPDKREFVRVKIEQLVNSWDGLLYEPSYGSVEAAVRCLRLLETERGLVARY